MSETMYPLPFRQLMDWAMTEYAADETIFGIRRFYRAGEKSLPVFGEKIETPFGPAAGPNTQMAQNIIAAYVAGARFFDLKTVQKIDGAELAACVHRPCILAEDECYNCEWSTELTVPQAYAEYVKAWCACKILAKVLGLGQPDGFVFHMSVGYDLAGVQGEKVDRYITGMMHAGSSPVFQECLAVLREMFPRETAYVDTISPCISRSVTVSTLHGCPPDEIERIAAYLITEKHLHTFVKCNPTLLGYSSARSILDGMGYDYIAFDEHHFREDLQYEDAVPMFRRLQKLARENNVEFGLKLSNTFPVDVTRGELPSEEMYMAGKSLYPLTVEMARRLSRDFDGALRLSYSGGADYFNIDKLFQSGLWPITMATTELKPGGCQRFTQIAEKLEKFRYEPFHGVDVDAVEALAQAARRDPYHTKAVKPLPRRKLYTKVPLMDCFTAPCKSGCPIGQDIPEYIELCGRGEYAKALKVILEKNPLPFITGTLCAHHCMDRCARNHYDRSVQIRAAKLTAAQRGYAAVMEEMQTPTPVYNGKKVAIIGGGPTGMAAAYFCARAGVPTTLFEKENALGGVVRHVIPAFRISEEAIEKDTALLRRMGAEIRLGAPAPSVETLKQKGYTHILLAIGAGKAGVLDIPGQVEPVIAWLRAARRGESVPLGHVVVVGGGNTAMDAARLAQRLGAESVTVVYRRTRREMPAEAEELELAVAEGVRFRELAAPVKQENGELVCSRMALGAPDASGRRAPMDTGETFTIPCDTVLSAVGERVDSAALGSEGVCVNAKGRPAFQTNLVGVYTAGDVLRGPATVVEGIADAAAFAEEVLGHAHTFSLPAEAYPSRAEAADKKGVLLESAKRESERCLSCSTVCETCVSVCPNRANVAITLPDGSRQILHVDRLCNECGNCQTFCPYDSAPYREKLTLYHTRETFDSSVAPGFLPLGEKRVLLRLNDQTWETDLTGPDARIAPNMRGFLQTILVKYGCLV